MTTPTPTLSHYNNNNSSINISPSFKIALIFIITAITSVNALGSASTTAVTYATATVCAIVAGDAKHFIKCYQQPKQSNDSDYYYYGAGVAPPLVLVLPDDVSFQAISGGRSFFCGLWYGGLSLYCWDTSVPGTVFVPKRIFHSDFVQLTDVTVGDSQVCARELHSGVVRCWRGGNVENGFEFHSPDEGFRFRSITSGCGFSCGILMENGKVLCWGDKTKNNSGFGGSEIQEQFDNLSMSSLVAGVSHVCGLTIEGFLVCKGNNDSGQLNVPLGSGPSEFSGLALGENFTCAIRRKNGLVLCWGGGGGSNSSEFAVVGDVSFESIVAGLDFVCGVTTMNLSVMCWGHGWLRSSSSNSLISEIPLGMVLPGICVKTGCGSCASYPNSGFLCHGLGTICYSCQSQIPLAVPLVPPNSNSTQEVPQEQNSSGEGKNMRVFLGTLVVGSVGAFAGLCTFLYFLWIGARRFLFKRKLDDSTRRSRAESDLTPMPNPASDAMTLGSFSSKKQTNSGTLRRYRSGNSSSSKHVDKIESFSLQELAVSTNNFSTDNKIGAGSFGSVYRGKLEDGRDVAIKRGDTSTKKKKFQEKEIAFDSELAFLSRLHHKHLVKLIGFCEEKDDKLLVYEYMSKGSLHDHLHDKNNVDKSSSILNSWKMRIKIALDAARGIEYIHNYAVPPIIHRDIKSSNILLDSNWNARVSDFGLSLIWPETETEKESMSMTKAVGTVGYIDPEYYVLNVLTTKSDVYGLGVVLLELLTGKRAVFKTKEDNNNRYFPVGVVEYAGPRIASGDIWSVLDFRVGKPEVNEVESVRIMAYTAMQCVNLEGKERPDMTEIVARLERALDFFDGSPSSLSVASCSKRFLT